MVSATALPVPLRVAEAHPQCYALPHQAIGLLAARCNTTLGGLLTTRLAAEEEPRDPGQEFQDIRAFTHYSQWAHCPPLRALSHPRVLTPLNLMLFPCRDHLLKESCGAGCRHERRAKVDLIGRSGCIPDICACWRGTRSGRLRGRPESVPIVVEVNAYNARRPGLAR